jgi:hypothetical protein
MPPIRRCGLYASQGEGGRTPPRPERGDSGAEPISASVATLSEMLGLAPKAGAGSLTKEQARAGHLGGLLDGYMAFGLSKCESYL